MSHIVVITAVGQDRPGILAALTGAVYELGGNLDDATMTRLHGAFATMVSARFDDAQSVPQVQAVLAPVAARLGLTVTVQAAPAEQPESPPDTLLTVYGADKPGIVHAVTSRLAAQGVNVTDMDTRVAGTPDAPVYVMLLEASASGVDLADDLAALRTEWGVVISRQDLDMEAL